MREPLKSPTYRDMQMLQEISQTPHATQRDLAKRIGIALGLANLMLRRLATKGYIKITSPKKGKIHYLLTRKGFLEKTRLSCEFIDYSLHLYGKIRLLLHEHLSLLKQAGKERIVLSGTDELAEIACLTIQEMGLKLVGVINGASGREDFLGHSVKKIADLKPEDYDRFVVVSLHWEPGVTQRLIDAGVPADRILFVSFHGLKGSAAASVEFPGRGGVPFRAAPAKQEASSSLFDPSTTDVVILCGGKGTRLGSLTENTPKPLLPVGKYPFLLRLILQMEQEGFSRFILAAHHLADHFRALLSTYSEVLPDVELVVEPEPLGTGGALRHAADGVRSSTVVVLNGDSWVSQPLEPVLADHAQARRLFTVVAVQASNVEGGALRKGVWRIGSAGDVQGFTTEESVSNGWVNAGIYVMDRGMVLSWPRGRYSLEENLPVLLNGKQAGVFCSAGRLLDIGTPECYERAAGLLDAQGVLV
ncbi:MAG: NTP transferase domain-containing protein [Candidatus Omnitrophica bacterium]|nr:NTP transferase domain-containing protein [Candidatus Omnitrophota bacterium]